MEATQLEQEALFNYLDFKKEKLIQIEDFLKYLTELCYDLSSFRICIYRLCEKYDKKVKDIFKVYDADKDGTIGFEEFDKMMQLLGFRLSSDELTEAFELFDFDGNGLIQEVEFVDVIEKKRQNEKFNFNLMLK